MSRWAVLLVVLGTLAGCSSLGGTSRPSTADDARPTTTPYGQAACNPAAAPQSPYQEVARASNVLPDDVGHGTSASAPPPAASGLTQDAPAADGKPVVADLASDPLGPLPKVHLMADALRTPGMENPALPAPAEGHDIKKVSRTEKVPEPAAAAEPAPAVPSLPDIRSLARAAATTQPAATPSDVPLPALPTADDPVGPLETAACTQKQESTVVAAADAPPAATDPPAKPEPAARPCAHFVGGIDPEPLDAEPASPSGSQGVIARKVQALGCPAVATPPADGTSSSQPNVLSLAAVTGPAGPAEPSVSDTPATACGVHFVNSKRFRLNYEVKDVGPSGIGGVEMWYTQDGRTWHKHDVRPHQHSPYVIEVADEDLYGFTLLVRSGAGMAKQPPRPGDAPQVWVTVDVTRPVVRLLGTEAGAGPRAGSLTILWTAGDKNLTQQPITLSYAEQAGGPWLPIATRLPNTGRYVWQIPPATPPRFLVRVEAIDQAGNVGTDQSSGPLPTDPAQPTVAIVNVEAARK